MKILLSICLCIVLLLTCDQLHAQIDYSKQRTKMIDRNPELVPKSGIKERRLLSIYTKDTKQILYGNPCMEQVTSRFGFQYVVMPKNAPSFAKGLNRWLHNFGVKFVLFFRNPFWSIIVSKKRKECRDKTADYMG